MTNNSSLCFQVGLAVGSMSVLSGAAYLLDAVLALIHYSSNN